MNQTKQYYEKLIKARQENIKNKEKEITQLYIEIEDLKQRMELTKHEIIEK